MGERVILADCCEDWILEWGPFYGTGASFACPECGTEWRKEAAERYRREQDGHGFVRRERQKERAAFPYLGAEDGREPLTERCCAKILLRHGHRMAPAELRCPVCGTQWSIGSSSAHGLRVPTFSKEGLEEPLTIQPGRTRPFLVALSRYSAPRE